MVDTPLSTPPPAEVLALPAQTESATGGESQKSRPIHYVPGRVTVSRIPDLYHAALVVSCWFTDTL